MKTTATMILAAAAAISAPFASADVVNRVTISGKVISVSEPVVRETPNSESSSSRLVRTGLTGASVLDMMVAAGDLPEKRGYSIVEIFSDAGVSQGLYAHKARTGETVEIDPLFLEGLTNVSAINAVSTSSRTNNQGTTIQQSSDGAGSASVSVGGTEAAAFLTTKSKLQYKNIRSGGENFKVPYLAINYTAVFHGVSTLGLIEDTVIEGKMASAAARFQLPAFVD